MHFLENSKHILLSWFYAPNSDFYPEIQELTQILLRISEEKIGSWGLCTEVVVGQGLLPCFRSQFLMTWWMTHSGAGWQAAWVQASKLAHCQGWSAGHATPSQLLQTLHMQRGTMRYLTMVPCKTVSRWSALTWVWREDWTTTLAWSMRRCCSGDLRLARRSPLAAWLVGAGAALLIFFHCNWQISLPDMMD